MLCQPGKWSGNESSGISVQGDLISDPELPHSLELLGRTESTSKD